MKEFNYNSQSHTPRSVHRPKSSLIKIPLLSSQLDDSHHSIKLPLIQQQQAPTGHHFSLLDFNPSKYDPNGLAKKQQKTATSKVSQKLNSMPLLKLNYQGPSELIQPRTPRDLAKTPNPPTPQISKQQDSDNEDQTSIKSSQVPSVRSAKSTKSAIQPPSVAETKETQCQKPIYDGYILAPNAFEEMRSEENRDPYSQMQYKATEHLRDHDHGNQPLHVAKKRETFTTTDGLSHP